MGLPAQGTSLPSNLEVYPLCMGFPCASVPSDVSLIPAGVASNVRGWARTAPEPSCDFAAFSFQVPTQFSPAKAVPPASHVTAHITTDHTRRVFGIIWLPSVVRVKAGTL